MSAPPKTAPERRGRLARWSRSPRVWSVIGCVVIAAALAAPTMVHCPRGLGSCELALNRLGGTGDWRFFAAVWEATRVAIVDFHELPSWNPFHCGGVVLYQDSQAVFPGLLFVLTFFWLPTAVAIKVWIVAHLLCGTLGTRALVADRGGNAWEQVLGAVLVGASGFVAQHTGGGHLSFTAFLFLPLILWSFRRALVDVRYIVLTAGLFALAAIQGGTYPVPLMAVALLIESAARLGSPADRRGLAFALPSLGLLFVLLSAVRMVPVSAYLREHPRLVPLDDQLTLGELFRFWTTRDHPRAVPGHPFVWPEYDAYVGVVPVVLMLAGLAIALFSHEDSRGTRRERRIDVVLFAGLAWCALGNIPGASLFGLLHELPIYASLRVPSRFLGPASVGLALLAVSSLVMVRSWLANMQASPRLLRVATVAQGVLVVGVMANVCLTNQRVMQQGLDPVLSRARASDAFFQASGVDYGGFPTFAVQGFGTRQCYTPLEWKPAEGIVDGRVPQAWVSPVEAGKVTPVRWSPNSVEVDVHLESDGMLIINQNYESGWRASAGTVGAYVSNAGRFWDIRARPAELPAKGAIGLLAVRLPRGDHHMVLRHRPRGLLLGAVLTALGIALAIAIIRRATPERMARLRRRLHERLFQDRDRDREST